MEPQVAPVFAIVTDDFDGDSLVDLLLCGNFSGLNHEVARQDANRGVVMKGDGHGNFMYRPPEETGIFIPGEVRDIKVLPIPGKPETLLIGRNNSSAMILQKAPD